MHPLNQSRSYLFVPTNRPDFIEKAPLKGADVIVLDLEDSVPQKQKASARKYITNAILQLKHQQQTIAVRINADLENLSADLMAIDLNQVNCIVLPKAEDAAVIRLIARYLEQLEQRQNIESGRTSLIPMIETCRGVLNMREIAQATPRIIALALGSEDLSSELGVPPTLESLINVCQQMALITGEARIAALGFPGSIGEFNDPKALSKLLTTAKNLGFSGALCVHPTQVLAANLVFVFSVEQQQWATRVVAAMAEAEQQGQGACQLDGRMIDAPVVALAQKILAQTER